MSENGKEEGWENETPAAGPRAAVGRPFSCDAGVAHAGFDVYGRENCGRHRSVRRASRGGKLFAPAHHV